MQNASYPPRPLTEQEIGWVAGLFEGEGCITLSTTKYLSSSGRKTQHSGARVAVCMTDEDVVRRLEALWPMPNGIQIRDRLQKPHYKTQYIWQLGRREHVAAFIRTILPLMGDRRRARAESLLAYAERVGRAKSEYCPNGHPYTEDNIHLKPDARVAEGHIRMCVICRREGWRRENKRRSAGRRAAKTDS